MTGRIIRRKAGEGFGRVMGVTHPEGAVPLLTLNL